ncbi:MAG TPA: hypothetical protein VIH72_10740 [Candidatus Acidoferrales bacterium]
MPRYDWSSPVSRLGFGMVVALGVVVSFHAGGKHRTTPIICNGGWHAGTSVFFQLFLAVAIVEVVGWAIWYLTIRQTVTPARPGIDDPDDYKLSGGKFLGPTPSYMSVALGILLIYFGLRVVGIPDVCPSLDVTRFSLRYFLGGLMMMYGIMMGTVYFWRELNGSS